MFFFFFHFKPHRAMGDTSCFSVPSVWKFEVGPRSPGPHLLSELFKNRHISGLREKPEAMRDGPGRKRDQKKLVLPEDWGSTWHPPMQDTNVC